MGLRFDPVGGGRFQQALQAIIQAEQKPIVAMENRKKVVEQKLKSFQEFKGKFSGFQNSIKEITGTRNLQEFIADVGDAGNLIDVTLDKTKVQPGSYSMRIEELANRSSMISNGFKDPAEKSLGIGYVVVHGADGEDFELFVDETKSSLNGIAQSINQLQEAPVSATVVRDATDPDRPWKMILSAKGEGAEEGVDFPEFYFLDGDERFWIDDSVDSENALVEINDYLIETKGNEVADFLEGVNIKLKGADPEKRFTLTIRPDNEKITSKIKDVVNHVNEVLDFINKQNQVDERSDTRTMFTGDTSLQTVEYRLRNLMHEGFPVWDHKQEEYRLKFLNEMGVGFERSGKLAFDENKFKQSLEKDGQGVVEAVSGELGFAYQLGEVLKIYTNPYDGLLSTKEKTLRQGVEQIDRNIESTQRRVDQKIQSLTQKFSRLQGTLGALQSQQQYLQATMGGGGGNLVEQLLGG